MFKKRKNKHELASTEFNQINVSTISDLSNMAGSSTTTSSLSRVNGHRIGSQRIQEIEEIQEELGLSVFKSKAPSKITTYDAENLTESMVSMNSLSSFSSASSIQRININGKPPRDFSKINIQRNYDARRGSDNIISEINGSFGTGSIDSRNPDEAVTLPRKQWGDLSMSIRDVIRNKPKSRVVQDSVTNKSKRKSSSIVEANEDDQMTNETNRIPVLMRVCIFLIVFLLCAAALGVLIHFLKNNNSSGLATSDTATCITYGVEFGRNCTIVCNTTFKIVSDIGITINLPMRTDVIKLTSQTPYRSGWAIYYDSKKEMTVVTLIGPPANCSSGGQYNITITNIPTNASLCSSINLEVNINATDINATVAGNVTLEMPNYNCPQVICQSNETCENSLLHIYSTDLSSNSYCCKGCSVLHGCTAHCNVTMQSVIHNSNMKCRLQNT